MENKRQQILEKAIEFIQKSGFDSFSYQDLSAAVGITKASIHYYFPSKEDLGVEVLKLINQRTELLMSIIDKQEDAVTKLNLYIQAIISTNGEGLICPISSLQAEYNVIPESMKQELQKLSAAELDRLTNILQQGLDEGVFDFKGPARDYASLFLTTIKGAIQYSRVLKEDLRSTVINLSLQLILQS
jgi:TetR/AcrR family transcriptional repressor of nem operon